MAISFNQVPARARRPFFYAEFSAEGAGATDVPFRSLLIGQKTAAGNAAADALLKIGDASAATAAFGRGSMLEHMVQAFRRGNPTVELWCIPLDDAGAGTKTAITITATAAATAAGTIPLYVAGRRVAVPIASGATTAQIATAIANAVTANEDLPVTAASAAAVATLTARHAGTATELEVSHSHFPDEALPPGVALTIAVGTAGATDPSIADALTAASVEAFDVIALPSYPTATVTAFTEELEDRWDASEQIDGLGIMAYRGAAGTVAQATTYGDALNSEHLVVADAGKYQNPGYEIAATIAGAAARSAEIDPARPFTTLTLKGILAPKVADRRAFADQESLLQDGISTLYVDSGGTVRIQRLITTYQENAAGVPDEAYLNANTPLTLSYLRRDFRNYIQGKYSRHKLVDDNTRVKSGQAVIRPKTGRAEFIAKAREWEGRGLVENVDEFKKGVVCERNAGDPDRLDWLGAPDLVNQFLIGAAKFLFKR